jgi:hypothetical protein
MVCHIHIFGAGKVLPMSTYARHLTARILHRSVRVHSLYTASSGRDTRLALPIRALAYCTSVAKWRRARWGWPSPVADQRRGVRVRMARSAVGMRVCVRGGARDWPVGRRVRVRVRVVRGEVLGWWWEVLLVVRRGRRRCRGLLVLVRWNVRMSVWHRQRWVARPMGSHAHVPVSGDTVIDVGLGVGAVEVMWWGTHRCRAGRELWLTSDVRRTHRCSAVHPRRGRSTRWQSKGVKWPS